MAIAKIKKIEIIGVNKDKESLLVLLQKLGKIQLIDIPPEVSSKDLQIVSLDTNLLEIQEAISFLASFKEKAKFLEKIANIKPDVYEKELKDLINNFDWQALLKELSNIRNQLKDLIEHKEKLLQRRQLLSKWHKLNIPLQEISATKHTGIFLGILSSRDYPWFLEDAARENINFYSEVISQDKTNTHLLIIFIQQDFERLDALLKNYHFSFVTLGRYQGTVKDNLLEINAQTLVLDDQIQDLQNKITELAREQFKLMIVYDYLANREKRNSVEQRLSRQEYTFTLSGWIKQSDIKSIEKELTQNFKEMTIFISQARADENIPVILENKHLLQPFEFITQIYGMPKYNELDPTPFLAPFFFLYFGFCVSDVGYGLILVLFSWFVLKKFKMGFQGIKFFRLFLFCGISTIVVGMLTGSWFGDLLDLLVESQKIFLPLKKLKDSLVLFNPLKEPTKLLAIALSLGIIQVWFGNIVAAIGNIKNKRYLGIIFDQVPTLTLLFGLTGLGLIFLKILDNAQINLFKTATLFAAIVLILTQGRSEKGLGSKLFYGVYNLYNALSGYLSDILSYSRLWALGLVTGVMAGTINLIAIQFSQIFSSIIPFIDKISFIKIVVSGLILITIFALGHLVSFLMNLLGAFVHPLRLQFVEFFSKFFKSGGSTFKPFKIETKYINIS